MWKIVPVHHKEETSMKKQLFPLLTIAALTLSLTPLPGPSP